MGPLVSVVLSVRNAEDTISLAVRSITRQSYQQWELILIDDGSTDATLERLRPLTDPRIRILADGENRGLATRLNQAIETAKGKYVARMDADDISCPDRFARQVEFLESNPQIDLLGTGAIVFRGEGQAVGVFPVRRTHEEICATPWSGFLLAHPTWMGRREWFVRYQYCDSAHRAQDQDLLLRAHQKSSFACLPDILLGYRQIDASAHDIVTGRYHYGRALWRYGVKNGAYGLAVRGVVTQFYRGIVGILTVGLGGAQRLLRRRYSPLGEVQFSAWQECWCSVYNAEQQTAIHER